MPRKKLIYTSEFPYHVSARANNKEWFYLDKEKLWRVFVTHLNRIVVRYKVNIYSFVLMSNHYHMLIQVSEEHDLGVVMCDFQKSVSRTINKITGRINHVFGGPYSGTLITNEEYYFNVYKYVYRNPVSAHIVRDIQDYEYSSYSRPNAVYLTRPVSGIDSLIDYSLGHLREWINEDVDEELYDSIKGGLKKTNFKYVKKRKY